MTSKNYNIASKEYQTLALEGQNLSISNGNTVELPTEPFNDIRFSGASWFTDDPYPSGTLRRE